MRTSSQRFMLTLAALVLAMPSSGCHAPKIRERPLRGLASTRHLRGLPETTCKNCGRRAGDRAGVSACHIECEPHPSPARLLALADASARAAAHVGESEALQRHRDAAVYSVFALQGLSDDIQSAPLRARAIARHNDSVEQLLRLAHTGPRKFDPAWRNNLAQAGVQVAATMPDRAALPYDQLWVARDFKVKNLPMVERCGLGVPLITLSCLNDRTAGANRFLAERLRLPATAVIHPNAPFHGGAWRHAPVVLALHDPARESVAALGPYAAPVSIAADLTTPLAHQVIVSPLTQFAWGGLLNPDTYTGEPGVFMQAPYQPGKIPVLFIHGLWSSPDAWLSMANALQADPRIRNRYQFWYAYYPTGATVVLSARRIREELHALRNTIDPAHADSALDEMVVVGHSLGGVLSKLLTQTSGDQLEKALLTRPMETVAISPQSRETLSSLLYFNPEPSISRVVFIAAPHRGSNTANQAIGRFGSSLIRRPGEIDALHHEIIALNGRDVLQPAFRRRPLNSIDNLERESPALQAIDSLPTAPGVTYHSVVATICPELPDRYWTDGVVSYESAHFHGADSELVIRHNHFATGTPEAIAEVRRILYQHVRELEQAP